MGASRFFRLVGLCVLVAATALLSGGCTAGPAPYDNDEDTGETAQAITGGDAVSRAMQWVDAKLKYCQAPNHAPDLSPACPSICNRKENKQWDPYRSDCSGLISWAWGLPPPGRTTLGFAPFDNTVSHVIKAIDLGPGDAVNNDGHVMLFKHWVVKGKRAVFIEEPGCSSSTPYAHQFTSDVSVSGPSIKVSWNGHTFHAIRYDKLKPELTLKAKAVKKWSNAERYRGKKADYIACAGDKVKMSFTFKNVGSAVWRDVEGRGKNIGNDVFLVTANGKKDKLTGKKRLSVRQNANHAVHGGKKAGNCSNKSGCRKTTFIKGAIEGTAPKTPGIYKSRWRLRDYSKAWGKSSHGFGPKVELALRVVSCNQPQKECGCRVWCSDGSTHKVSTDKADDSASCKAIGQTICKPGTMVSHSLNACLSGPEPDPTPQPSPEPTPEPAPSSGGQSGVGGAGSGAGGTSASGGTTSSDPTPEPTAGAGGQAGDGSGDGSSDDEGDEDDPNGYPLGDGGEDPDEAEDDPDFEEDGFDGDADYVPPSMEESGCSVAPGGLGSRSPFGLGAALVGLALVEARRRSRRRSGRAAP